MATDTNSGATASAAGAASKDSSDAAPSTPAAQAPAPVSGASLTAQVNGGQIVVTGTGFEPGARLDIQFTRPDGRVDPTVALADEQGNLTTYARNYGQGRHQVSARGVDGSEVASAKFTV